MAATGIGASDWIANITRELKDTHDNRPALIPHVIESIIKREILRQNNETAQARLRDLRLVIEHLKLAKEYGQLIHDVDRLKLEEQKRLKTLDLEILEIDSKRESQLDKAKLESLRERKKIELDIAKLDHEIETLKNPPKSEAKVNPEEQKAKRHAASEARLKKLKAEIQAAGKIADEHERTAKQNALDDKFQAEMEEWRNTL